MSIDSLKSSVEGGDVKITVAACVREGERFLFIEEQANNALVISQPAGRWEPGESLIDAVVRETWEESAYRFVPEAISGVHFWYNQPRQRVVVRVNFTGHVTDHDPQQPLDDGIERSLWLSRAQLLAMPGRLRSPLVLRAVDDHLAGHRYPLELVDALPLASRQKDRSA